MRRLIILAVAFMALACLSGCKRSIFNTPHPPYGAGPRNDRFADQASDITSPDMCLKNSNKH